VLTKVQEPTAETEAFRDADAGAPTQLWAGSVRAYFSEKRDRTGGGGISAGDLLVRRSLFVAEGDAAVTWEAGLILTFALDGGASQTGTVQNVERRILDGIPASLQTTRLTLEDA
jgi:hypothetical protein